jgi:hypothetical protein
VERKESNRTGIEFGLRLAVPLPPRRTERLTDSNRKIRPPLPSPHASRCVLRPGTDPASGAEGVNARGAPATDHNPFPPHNDARLFLRLCLRGTRFKKIARLFGMIVRALYSARLERGCPSRIRTARAIGSQAPKTPVARLAKPRRSRFPRARLVASSVQCPAAGDRDKHAHTLHFFSSAGWLGWTRRIGAAEAADAGESARGRR